MILCFLCFFIYTHNFSSSISIRSPYNYSSSVSSLPPSPVEPVAVSHVYRLLLGLSSNKATGIDKITCEVIKKAAPAISDSLTLIFNQSITSSCFPDEWKTAKVIPLYKNGQRNVPGKYRPIFQFCRSLTKLWNEFCILRATRLSVFTVKCYPQ